MYCVVAKYGRGSWTITNFGKVYDDREKAAAYADNLRVSKRNDPSLNDVQVKVVYMGDADMWKDA